MGLTPHQVLTELYDALKSNAQVIKQIKGAFRLGSVDYGKKNVQNFYLHYNGVIARIGSDDCIFAYGKPDRISSKSELLKEAIIFGKIDWNLIDNKIKAEMVSKNRTVGALNKEQISMIVRDSMNPAEHLIGSAGDNIGIEIRTTYWKRRDLSLPENLLSKGYPMEAKGVVFYKEETVPYLQNYIYERLGVRILVS